MIELVFGTFYAILAVDIFALCIQQKQWQDEERRRQQEEQRSLDVGGTESSTDSEPQDAFSADARVPRVLRVQALVQAGLHLQDEELGAGAFGSVRRGIFRDNAAAVKPIDHHAHDGPVPKEVEILHYLSKLKHPCILHLHACLLHEDKLLMVTELIPGRDLERNLAILQLNEVSDSHYINELRFFARQIVRAVAFLHDNNVGHFDLKGTNVMVDKRRVLKIIGFGMAEIVRGPLTARRESTAHYLAPEMMRINRRMEGAPGYGLAADVWSFGVCLYYWYAGSMPFANDEDRPFDIYNEVLHNFIDQPAYGGFDGEVEFFIQPLLNRQPGDRPTFQQLAMDPFLEGDFQALSTPSILEPNGSPRGAAGKYQ